MLIKAKFAGRCIYCNEGYATKMWINWEPGKGCWHSNCEHKTPEQIVEEMRNENKLDNNAEFLYEENEHYFFRKDMQTQIIIVRTNKAGLERKVVERQLKHYCARPIEEY